MYKFIMSTVLILFSLNTLAGPNRAISCNGCSKTKMSAAATNATHTGTVYVFSTLGAKVRKYAVVTEDVDSEPYTVWKQAFPLSVERKVKNSFKELVSAMGALQGNGTIVLPPGFEIGSVAGAFLDPAYSTTHIEDFLRDLGMMAQTELQMAILAGKLAQAKVPFIDVQALIDKMIINIEFPDGSSMDYVVEVSLNPISGEARTEVSPYGNARLPNGQPAPTSSSAFAGKTFFDTNGSIYEWITWASQLGLTVTGSGTVMKCTVIGSEIHCVVKKKS